MGPRVSFFMNRFRNLHLVIHLAHDLIRRKRTEPRQIKGCRCPVSSTTLPKTVLPRHPVARLSEQGLEILRLFAPGKNSPEILRAYKSAFKPCATTFTKLTSSYALTIDWER